MICSSREGGVDEIKTRSAASKRSEVDRALAMRAERVSRNNDDAAARGSTHSASLGPARATVLVRRIPSPVPQCAYSALNSTSPMAPPPTPSRLSSLSTRILSDILELTRSVQEGIPSPSLPTTIAKNLSQLQRGIDQLAADRKSVV